MSPDAVIDLSREAFFLALYLLAPLVILAALIGLVIGFLQAVTSIQDQSISVAAKLLVVGITMLLASRWMGSELMRFSESVFDKILGI
jgi:type III secretion HrpO family protein